MIKEIEEQCYWAIQWLGPRLNIDFTSSGNEWAWSYLLEAVHYAGSGFEFREFKTPKEYYLFRQWEVKVEGHLAIHIMKWKYMKGEVSSIDLKHLEEYYHNQQMRIYHAISRFDPPISYDIR